MTDLLERTRWLGGEVLDRDAVEEFFVGEPFVDTYKPVGVTKQRSRVVGGLALPGSVQVVEQVIRAWDGGELVDTRKLQVRTHDTNASPKDTSYVLEGDSFVRELGV